MFFNYESVIYAIPERNEYYKFELKKDVWRVIFRE